jgi:DNA-binding winged helix-turn-helix (wHTH) protein/TolB-like protein
MAELQVGACTVRPEINEVLRDGESTHLEPKSMALLCHLIAHRGEMVERETLLDTVWPGVHVGDDSLTAAIIKIRRALGDDARNPSYVETIPKRGYRLIAEVHPATARSGDLGSEASVATDQPPRNPGRRNIAASIVLLALAAPAAALLWPRKAPPVAEAPAARPDGQLVVSVAPFVNASHDPDQDYLAQGIGESILTDLALLPDFTVRHHRPTAAGASAPRRGYLLEGSVVRDGSRIRIEARLIETERGDVLAALRFDRPFASLLSIEDEIRDAVVGKLTRSIGAAERSRRARGYTDDVAAYDLFLKGQRYLLVRTRETNLAARKLYRQAIEADPTFARAYGGLALTHAAEYRNGWAAAPKAALRDAMKYARTAIDLAPALPEQHWVIGYVLTQQRRYDAALAELNAAIRIDSGYADAYALSGGVETYRGHPDRSIPLLRQAMRLNPDAGYLYFLLLARAYYFLGDFQQAQINLKEALDRNPENVEAHLYLAATLLRLGKREDASWETMEVQNIEPGFALADWGATYPMARGGRFDGFVEDLRRAGFS